MRTFITRHENKLVWLSISFSLCVWLYGLNRNLNLPFIGDSLGYVSRAQKMSMFGVMNHEPIDPFGVPIQSLGYSALLSLVPYNILLANADLRIIVAVFQFVVYLAASQLVSKSIAKYLKLNWKTIFLGFMFFWPAVLISTEVLADSIALSLHLVLLAVLIRQIISKSKLLFSVLSGITLGTLIIVRPNSALVTTSILFATFLVNKRPMLTIKNFSQLAVIASISLLVISPQVAWTYQQFGQAALIRIDDSYTGGLPISVSEQNARATYLQLNGCVPPVDCVVVNRNPGPLSERSYVSLGTDFPVWNKWFLQEPGYASLQAGLILFSTLDQEFFFTYLQYPDKESNYLSLSVFLFVLTFGFRALIFYVKNTTDLERKFIFLLLTMTAPYIVFQLLVFHGENRYGLVPALALFVLAISHVAELQKRGLKSSARLLFLVLLISQALTQVSWNVFVQPLL